MNSQEHIPSRRPPVPKALFLHDDSWRIEKRDLFLFLKGKVEFGIATYDDETYREMHETFTVHKLPIVKLTRGLRYYAAFCFARDLDTNNIRYRKNVRLHTAVWWKRVLFRCREWIGTLPVPQYTASQALDYLYRGSNRYADVLDPYDVLVMCPVHNKDYRIVYEAKQRGMKILVWVYSWDHPMKDNEFFAQADHYFVWNAFMADDLQRLHGIPAEKATIVGGVQFDGLLERMGHPRERQDPRYVLVGCTAAMQPHVEQEVTILLHLRDLLDAIDPAVELWIRPYPYRDIREASPQLAGRKGVRVLSIGENVEDMVLLRRDDHQRKFDQVWNAECLLNFASTLGLEASFSETSILQLNFNYPTDYPWYYNIREYYNNEHVKRYLLDARYPNVVSSEAEMKERLAQVLAGDLEPFRAYTAHLQSIANPLGVPSHKAVFAEKLAAWMQGCGSLFRK